MDPQDDPEARIRALEQPSIDMARASELGQLQAGPGYGYVPPLGTSGSYPPPPATVPHPAWGTGDVTFPTLGTPTNSAGGKAAFIVPVVIAVIALAAAGGVTLYLMSGPSERPSISGGGATLTDRPSIGEPTPAPGTVAPPADEPLPPGTSTSIAGIGERKSLACNDTIVSISGFDNTVELTGRCAMVSVSGKDNVVTIDESAVIGVSGFDNRIVFHAGEPEVTNSGFGNTVDRG